MLDFYLTQDPVTFEDMVVSKNPNQKKEKATVREVALWNALLKSEGQLNECRRAFADLMAGAPNVQ